LADLAATYFPAS